MRSFTEDTVQPPRLYAQPSLHFDKLLAIYARQSTKKQLVNNKESHEQQTKELWQLALDYGWNEENIIIYIENLRDGKLVSASATLRIDERPELQALTERIEKDEVKTVLVWAVDRLFRDEDMIQPAVFAKLCKDHGCIVLTIDDIFDFNNTRRDDRKRFLELAQAAADYSTKHVKGRMLPARARVSMRGQADGRKVSVGYIVDRREFIEDGSENPKYKRFVPYLPHAKVVRWLFKRYRELNGNLNRLYREIEAWPLIFPFFEDSENAKYLLLSKNDKGYVLTKGGLAVLLTNVVYLGWWYFKGRIVSKNNHDAIVGADDFWYAFNRLSPYTLDGERNVRATSQVHNRTDKPDSLLQGIITSTNKRRVYVVGTDYRVMDEKNRVSIGIADLDRIFLDRLFTVLNDREHGETIEQRLREVQALREHALVSVDEQIAETKRQLARAERDKRIAEDEDYEDGIRAAIRDIKRLNNTLTELESKKEQATTDELNIEECQNLLECVRDGWNELTFEKRRRFIRLIAQSVVLSEASTHFLKLEIVWTGPYGCTDVGYIWRENASGGMYTEEENAIIRELYPVADRAVILESLPHRSWTGILVQARHLGLARNRSCGNTSKLHIDLSRQDKEIIDSLGLVYDVKWPDKWAGWLSPSDNKTDFSP
ncbi:MAG TPA: recombinase family protein [Ktedonobacteraceae bacterium]|nr:recombinase family protein [Ktedonobacteraceae bacterium]